MKNHYGFSISLTAGALFLFGGAMLNAQITQKIQAHISHSFVVADKVLPPGDYTFLMHHENEATMTVSNDADNKSITFKVGQTVMNHVPKHGELVFRKYGDTEVLSKIFQSGEPRGIALTENKKREAELAKGGKFEEHIEETR